ncbi:MAG: restriction endonuclease subunit S [Sulfurovum sp.]|nr:restriction endonuclease subunit S [Sulfurovum sp.]
MEEWREVKLNDYLEATSSKRIFAKEYVEVGIPFYRSKEIIEKEHGKKINTPLYISNERFYEIKNKFGAPKDGDILISAVGERSGIPYVVSNDGDFYFKDGNLIWLKNFQKDLSSGFLYRWFKSKNGQYILLNSMIGSAQRALTIQGIKNLVIQIPPLKEQKAIAEVLSSLDNKIDLLHRQNKTLEALVQTLFRQWFIEEAGDEWEVGTLGDIMVFNPTHSLKKGEMYPFLEMGNVQTFKSSVAGWYERAFTSGTKFKNGDTLLARITPSLENGKTAYVDFLKDDEIGWGSTEFIVMRMKKGYHPFISYLIARNEDFREFAVGNMTGSTGRQRAQAKDIKEYEISIPPIEIIEKLNKAIDPIPIKIKAHSEQIKTLENLRDILLPKLMSGEVRVET